MSQRATRFLEQAVTALPAPTFVGDLIRDLEHTIESAEEGNGKLRILPDPQPPTKPNERPWIRLVDLGAAPMRCNSTDCPRSAKLLLESRDQEVLPYCTACALVEIALWLAGV
jgi:hypothetical protein